MIFGVDFQVLNGEGKCSPSQYGDLRKRRRMFEVFNRRKKWASSTTWTSLKRMAGYEGGASTLTEFWRTLQVVVCTMKS